MDADVPVAAIWRGSRRPLLEIGDAALRLTVPVVHLKRGRILDGLLVFVLGLELLRLLVALALPFVLLYSPIVILLGDLVSLAIYGWAIPVFLSVAYRFWGRQLLSVEDGIAELRVEIWHMGFRWARVAVGPGTVVAVVDEFEGRASVRIDGFRTGPGLRRQSLTVGRASFTPGEAVQIAQRIGEAVDPSNKRVERAP